MCACQGVVSCEGECMHGFRNDYSEIAHPLVLEKLAACAHEQNEGYGEDAHCDAARALIRAEMTRSLEGAGADAHDITRVENAQIEFAPGGTMANLLALSAILRPYECVIAAPDGHINVHETGAVEATGHKVLTTVDPDGLLSAAGVDAVMAEHCFGKDHHMVMPKALYLSFATEMGMVHTAAQLAELRAYADAHDLLIYVDGARLACGLASGSAGARLADIIRTADAFTFGATKNGALFGEAIVMLAPERFGAFKAHMKQRGAMMAKGFLYGIQLEALFGTRGADAGIPEARAGEAMYFSLGRHANVMADHLREALETNGFDRFASDARTNQVFVIVDDETAALLRERFGCEPFGSPDPEHTIVRFTCSWATEPGHIRELDRALRELRS